MTNMKTSKTTGTARLQDKMTAGVEGEDFPFGPPPEEYPYRCSHCQHEMKVNEAIIDVEIAKAEYEGRNVKALCPLSAVLGAIEKQWNMRKVESARVSALSSSDI